VNKNLATALIEKGTSPTCKVLIKPIQQRLEISEFDFGGGEGKTQIRLGEGGDRATESSCHGSRHRGVNIHRNEGAFLKVDVQARELRESGENFLEEKELREFTVEDDQSVVSVLQSGAKEVRGERVLQLSPARSLKNELPQHISNKEEKVGR